MLTAPYVHFNNNNNTKRQSTFLNDTTNSQNQQQQTMIDYTNLYIKNLDAEVTSYDLFKRFRVYGKIISARVMKDTITGKSKGYGFVSFTHMDEANEALAQMNGALVNTKNIVVTFHEHKKALPMTQQQQQQQQEHDLIQFGTSPPRSTTTIACYPSPQSTSYNGFIPEQQQHLVSIKHTSTSYNNNPNPNPNTNPWNETGIWMHQQQQQQKPVVMIQQPQPQQMQHHHTAPVYNNTMMHHNHVVPSSAVTTTNTASVVSPSTNTTIQNQIQYQKLREAISLQLTEYQQKDLNDLVDLIQSLKKRELSLCLFNPTFLKQKIDEAYEALYLFQSSNNNVVTTPALVHHHGGEVTPVTNSSASTTSQQVAAILTSLEGMTLNKKKRVFGDIFFPYVRATGVKHAPKVTIRLLDTVPLDELAFNMYDKKELSRKAQIAYNELYA